MTPTKIKQMLAVGLLLIGLPACLVQHKINVWAGKVNAHCKQSGGKDACLNYPACNPDGTECRQ